jgi:ribonuclease HII
MRRTRQQLQRRFAALRAFDQDCHPQALEQGLLAGVDEAGVGPLAGPVVAAAVVLPANFELPELFDSKQLSAADRQHCETVIRARALCFGISRIAPTTIDSINILNAMLRAHRRALQQLERTPCLVLVDGHRAPALPGAWESTRLRTVVRGDATSMSIAAASILAKSDRDRLMQRLDRRYPGYGFAEHKGYATLEHKEAIRKLGLSPAHRMSFNGWIDDEKHLRRQMLLRFD